MKGEELTHSMLVENLAKSEKENKKLSQDLLLTELRLDTANKAVKVQRKRLNIYAFFVGIGIIQLIKWIIYIYDHLRWIE